MNRIFFFFALLCITVSCSEKEDAVVPEKVYETLPECIVWNHEDSLAMELCYFALSHEFTFGYENPEHVSKLIGTYEGIAHIHHRLPGMYLKLGKLYEKQGESDKAFHNYRLEIQHDWAVLRSDLPNCRKHEFRVDLFHAYVLVGDQKAADKVYQYLERNLEYGGSLAYVNREQALYYFN